VRPSAGELGVKQMTQALSLENLTVQKLGEDVLLHRMRLTRAAFAA